MSCFEHLKNVPSIFGPENASLNEERQKFRIRKNPKSHSAKKPKKTSKQRKNVFSKVKKKNKLGPFDHGKI